jgi:predicted transcriptional regulator of viral defense system
MSSQLEKKVRDLKSDYVNYSDLCTLLPFSNDARYGQVKRALKEGSLVRLKKAVYRRAKYLEQNKAHPFEMAQYLLWPSYVSLLSALSYHSLIPEGVFTTTCVTPHRKQSIQNTFGLFTYHKIPHKNFFLGVKREAENNAFFYVASPWKAITDYIYCYKKNWDSLSPLMNSLRIDIDLLPPLNKQLAEKLSLFYQSKRIDTFLNSVLQKRKNDEY